MDEKQIILSAYQPVWKWPKKIYSIDTIKLIIPIDPEEALYFGVSLLITWLLGKVLPFYTSLPFVIKNVAVPFLLMKFLKNQKLDGKLPHKFFIDYVAYIVQPKKYCRGQPVREIGGRVKLVTPIHYRRMLIKNKTELALKGALHEKI